MSYTYYPKNCPYGDLNAKAIYPRVSSTKQTEILDRCKKICDNTPGCNAFSYDSKQYSCYLKKKTEKTLDMQDISDLRCYYKE